MAELAEAVPEEVTELGEALEEGIAETISGVEKRMLALGVGIGLVGGFIVGGWVAMRRLETKYSQLAESEIDEMREHFRKRLIAKEEKPDLAAKASEISEREGYSGPATPKLKEDKDAVEAEEEGSVLTDSDRADAQEDQAREDEASSTEVTNLFEETKKEADEDWDYEEEVRLRRPERPYIIHVDEQHEREYTESTLTYYAADDVLCDERDTPIEDKEKVVGEGNLEKFGHGSHDKNVVYIRNDVLGIEVEIIKNDGSYAEVVHGFVQHSDEVDHHRRRPRFDDEPGAA